MKKLNKIQSLSIALIAILGIIAVYFIIIETKPGEEIIYPYTTAIERDVPGDMMMGIVHDRDELPEEQRAYEFHYNISKPQAKVYIDHPMVGIKCALVEYTSELDGDTVILNEMQNGDCDEPQKFYITTALTESRPFTKVRLNQIVNGKTIESKEFEIDPEVLST